jgi:hypothetical protein
MSAHLRSSLRTGLLPIAWGLGLVFAAVAVKAQERPWYVGASQSFTHDSNVFRTNTNGESDTVSGTGLLAGVDIPFGRQRFSASASAQSNRHQNHKELNNTGYSLTSALDLATVERLSGTLRYMARQDLADFGLAPGAPANVEKSQQFTASARWGLAARLGLTGGIESRKLNYTVASYRNFTQKAGSVGLQWGGTGLLTAGVGLRVTKGDYPQALVHAAVIPVDPLLPIIPAVFGPDKTDRNDIDFNATWTPTGLSTVSGRVSVTHETHSESAFPTLSAITGSVLWDYKPTGRLAFKTSLTRDTGSETSFSPSLLPDTTSSTQVNFNRINTVVQLGVSYELTAKIGLNAGTTHTQSSLNSALGSSSGEASDSYTLGARYVPTRTISLLCNLAHQSRSNLYSANVASCLAQITLP